MVRFAAALVAMMGVFPGMATPAKAQSSIASVNGEPITSRDVDQRMKVSSQLFREPLSRPAAIQQLIDDKVKLNEGRRVGMRATQAGLDEMISRLASSVRQTPTEFERNLVRAGIDPEAVRTKLSADTIWAELLRQRARSGNISNTELNDELARRVAKGEAQITDYTVRRVIFVVPPGTSPGQRERDANAARGRFADCETGVEYMRTLRDVAVQERIGRSSTELSKPMNDTLSKTPLGRLTAPYRSEQGVEMLAVCEKTQRQDQIQLRNQIERELLEKRTQGTSTSYLNELRSRVDIKR